MNIIDTLAAHIEHALEFHVDLLLYIPCWERNPHASVDARARPHTHVLRPCADRFSISCGLMPKCRCCCRSLCVCVCTNVCGHEKSITPARSARTHLPNIRNDSPIRGLPPPSFHFEPQRAEPSRTRFICTDGVRAFCGRVACDRHVTFHKMTQRRPATGRVRRPPFVCNGFLNIFIYFCACRPVQTYNSTCAHACKSSTLAACVCVWSP